jgi:hypothetical protein
MGIMNSELRIVNGPAHALVALMLTLMMRPSSSFSEQITHSLVTRTATSIIRSSSSFPLVIHNPPWAILYS